jgi:hypothetical protein
MKPANWDTQLGLASPLEYAAIQSSKIKNPSKKETGLDASYNTRVSLEGGENNFFLTSSFIARHSRNQNTVVSVQLSALGNQL